MSNVPFPNNPENPLNPNAGNRANKDQGHIKHPDEKAGVKAGRDGSIAPGRKDPSKHQGTNGK